MRARISTSRLEASVAVNVPRVNNDIANIKIGRVFILCSKNPVTGITTDTVSETADYPEALLPNYVAEIEDFQRAVATGGQPAATGLDGLRVVEVTLAMIESARTRRSVKIERIEA